MSISYSDEDVERQFGLTTSKMRTAQRYGLARASSGFTPAQGRRRAWSSSDVLLTYAAEELDRSLAIPFEVAARIVRLMPADALEAIQHQDVCGDELINIIPLVCVYDRRQITLRRDEELLVGELVRDGASNKTTFNPVDPRVIEPPQSNAYAESCLGHPISTFKIRNLRALFAAGH